MKQATAGQAIPLISAIVAVHNGSGTLQQCLDSVARQDYPRKELIVIDGASDDGTVDLLRANQGKLSYWISEPDHGIYHAWNKAVVQARGDWIFFLGADDFLWGEQVLSRVVSQLAHVPDDVNVVYSQVNLVNAAGDQLYSIGQPWPEVKSRFRQVMCIPHPSVLHRNRLFRKNGIFDESFRVAGDYELLLRELKDNDAFFIPGIIFSAMRQGGISSAPANTMLGLREVRVAQRKNAIRWPGWIWLTALARVYIRLLLWSSLGERRTRIMLDWGRRLRGSPDHWTKT